VEQTPARHRPADGHPRSWGCPGRWPVASLAPHANSGAPVVGLPGHPTSGQARRPSGGAGHVGEPTRL